MTTIDSKGGKALKTSMNRRAMLGRLTMAAGAAYIAPAMLSLSQARASGGNSYSAASYSTPSYSAPSYSRSSYSGGSRSSSSGSGSGSSRSSFSGGRKRSGTLDAWWRRMFAR
jgi:hypothetical protein